MVLVSLTATHVDQKWVDEMSKICEQVHPIPLSRPRSVRNVAMGLLKGLPMNVSYFYNTTIERQIKRIYREVNPDFTYVQLIRMALYARSFKGAKAIDYMDAFSLRVERRLSLRESLRWFWKFEKRRLASFEARVSDWFAHRFVIAPTDATYLEANGVSKMTLLKNGVDTDFFRPNDHLEKPYDIAFVGNMSYHPNIVAAQFLVNKILPVLKKTYPSIRVLIAGARPSSSVKKLAGAGVAVSGYLPDIRSAYQSAKIFVAPIFVGSGLQNKILEAMAMGMPCVTTPIVAKPIQAPKRLVQQANNVGQFVDQITQFIEDEELLELVRLEARHFVKEHFSWIGSCTPLAKLLKEESVVEKESK